MKTIRKVFAGLLTMAAIMVTTYSDAQGLKGDKDRDKQNEDGGGMSGYKTGIGLRGGWEGGLTVKHFIKSNRAIEGIFSRGWGHRGARITGLYEIHKSFPNTRGLDWFYGIGGHVGFYGDDYYDRDCGGGGYYDKDGDWHRCKDRYTVLGIDGILGLEYQFSEIPFTIGVDIKPFIDIVGWGDHFGDGAFSIRYTIK